MKEQTGVGIVRVRLSPLSPRHVNLRCYNLAHEHRMLGLGAIDSRPVGRRVWNNCCGDGGSFQGPDPRLVEQT
jgi:hypothetical protein